jgi:hypothetical protein
MQEDSAGTGTVVFAAPDGAGRDSVWFAIDLATGEVAVAAPAHTTFRRVDPQARGLDSVLGGLGFDGIVPDILVVRREVGAWVGSLGEHAIRRANGRAVVVDPLAMRSLGNRPAALHAIKPHDLVLVIDGPAGEYFTSEVTK